MDGYARQKVPGGKLLAVKVRYADRIQEIKITGDFFLYPEDKLSDIEAALFDAPVDATEQSIAERIRKIVDLDKIELIGVTPEAIASTIKMAVMGRTGA